MDISSSVDSTDFHLQRNGLAKAFRDPEVIDLISILPGGIIAAQTYWSGDRDQQLSVGWHKIQSTSDAIAFADKIEESRRIRAGILTAIGTALLHADQLFNSKPLPCHSNVIDISSDGRSNAGPDVNRIANTLAAKGIIINALIIHGEDKTIIPYFQHEVIRGSGAFVETANGYTDYARAIKQKIIRELSPVTAHNKIKHTHNSKFAYKAK